MNDQIKIGRTSFLTSALQEISLPKALETYAHIDKRIVARAWNEANPEEKKSEKKKQSPREDTSEGIL
jgi:hypothetical protein